MHGTTWAGPLLWGVTLPCIVGSASPKPDPATQPGTLLRRQMPTRGGPPDTTRPGSVESETVADCGDTTAGDYVNSHTFTELFSGWTENRAVWNKSRHAILGQLKELEEKVPFKMKNFHTDNGSEFLNWALHEHLTGRSVKPPWTRSRAYRKNDNAHCEQKHWTQVRQLFGHDRFEPPELVALMNELYAQEWRQFTHRFKPTFKVLKRDKRGSKTVRRLERKCLLASTAPLAVFGHTFQLAGLRRFCPKLHVLLSDGDEGLEWMREKCFPQATWLLDRWHSTQAMRALVTNHQPEYRRIMATVWQADREALLQALATSPLREERPQEFRELFGYVLGNRHGVDDWKDIPAPLRRSDGRRSPAVKCGSGAVEKNIEVSINRRFKRQGRSSNPQRAEWRHIVFHIDIGT
jgi:hypothetical protein